MALSSTVYNFDIDLSDSDRDVYETLAIRAARHPSETDESLVARVLAYCLEYREGIEFSKGLSEPDEPAIAVRDLTGVLQVWIDVGAPSADWLHRASKAVARVAVYNFKEGSQWLDALGRVRIHRADELALHGFEPALIAALVARLARRTAFSLAVADEELFASFDEGTVTGRVRRLRIPGI